MTPEVQYARKKKTLADAQALIQSGDVIAVSGAITEPVVFLNHLSDIIPRLEGVTLLKSKENAVSLRETVKQFLGVEYNIRAKCSEPEQQASKAQNLVQKAMANHLDTAVENE